MSEEDKTEEDARFFLPSNVGDAFRIHSRYMELCKELPENRSFAVPRHDAETDTVLHLGMLRKIANAKSVGKLSFVVIEHPGVFEVSRLPDGTNTALFYESVEVEKASGRAAYVEETAEEFVLKLMREAIETPFEQRRSYDPNYSKDMADEQIVSYAYLHRKATPRKPIKGSGIAPTDRLKATLKSLCDMGKVAAVPVEYAKDTYQTSAKLYRLIED